MRRPLSCEQVSALAAAVVVGLCSGEAPAAEPVAPDRRAELINLLQQDCGSCHGLTMKGGLGPSLLPAALATHAEDVIANTILFGMPGTPMPPWRGLLSETEAQWLAQTLKNGFVE